MLSLRLMILWKIYLTTMMIILMTLQMMFQSQQKIFPDQHLPAAPAVKTSLTPLNFQNQFWGLKEDHLCWERLLKLTDVILYQIHQRQEIKVYLDPHLAVVRIIVFLILHFLTGPTIKEEMSLETVEILHGEIKETQP